MIFEDDRGVLHSLAELPFRPKQILVSTSHRGVLRGLHQSPYAKYVYVLSGEIRDVFFDPEGGPVTEKTLGAGDNVIVPPLAAHGFYCNKRSTVLYALDGLFDPVVDKNIYFDTPGFLLPSFQNLPSLVLSEKDQNANYAQAYDYLLLGGSGFLGGYMHRVLHQAGHSVLSVSTRLCNVDELRRHIAKSKCKYVLVCAGISGRPTIEWCESHEKETYEINYLDMINLFRICEAAKVHTTVFGSGLVYDSSCDIYSEDDPPNEASKVYSRYRIKLEEVVGLYPNVLYLRILFPVSLDGHPKCFATKIRQRAETIHDVRVPLTVLPDLFPKIPSLIEGGCTGIYNFVNEGRVSLKRLLELTYPDVDPRVVENAAAGGNFELRVAKLKQRIPVLPVEEALTNARSKP